MSPYLPNGTLGPLWHQGPTRPSVEAGTFTTTTTSMETPIEQIAVILEEPGTMEASIAGKSRKNFSQMFAKLKTIKTREFL